MLGTSSKSISVARNRRPKLCPSLVTSKKQCRLALDATHSSWRGLLRGGVECPLAGETETGKDLLRDYVNATTGFEEFVILTSNPR